MKITGEQGLGIYDSNLRLRNIQLPAFITDLSYLV